MIPGFRELERKTVGFYRFNNMVSIAVDKPGNGSRERRNVRLRLSANLVEALGGRKGSEELYVKILLPDENRPLDCFAIIPGRVTDRRITKSREVAARELRDEFLLNGGETWACEAEITKDGYILVHLPEELEVRIVENRRREQVKANYRARQEKARAA